MRIASNHRDLMAAPRTQGFLEVIIGPMYSGKTSRLLTVYKQMRICDVPVLVVNYVEDVRYSKTMLSTHDKSEIPCVFVDSLCALRSRDKEQSMLAEAQVVLINEGQFFADLYQEVHRMVEEEGKQVYVCGLDGDFRRQAFGDLLKLIPLADEVIKLRSLCRMCKDGTPALFSHRVRRDVTEQKLIGTDEYTPLCRKCFKALNT